MENNENQFHYTYSAKEQEEIKRIRQKYVPREEDKMAQLRRLDASVYQKASVRALVYGIVGTLVMGTGMSCCMVWAEKLFLLGLMVGILGMVLICLAYPVYNRTLKKERERMAPEILRLTDELMQ